MVKWLKIIVVSLFGLFSGITSFATAEESYEQRIEKLEDLLEIYFEENRQLKQKVSDLENKLESFDKAASAKPKTIREECEADINGCSDENVCAIATRTKDSVKKWKLGNKFFYEAKRRGLTCGVKLGSNKLTAKQRCEANIRGCSEADLCETATYGTTEKNWSAMYTRFVDEAKRRGLTCGVKSADTCKSNIKNCTNGEICKQLKLSNESESKKYFLEAESRGLSCGAPVFGNPENTLVNNYCPNDVTQCDEKSLCDTATWIAAGNKKWKVGAYTKFVDEAKRRGLTCGVAETTVRPKSTSPKISDNRDKSIPKDCTSRHLQLAKDVWQSVLSTTLSWHEVEKLIAWCNQSYAVWTVKFGGSGASAPTIQWSGTKYIAFAGQGIFSKTVQCVDITTLSYTNRTPNWSGDFCK